MGLESMGLLLVISLYLVWLCFLRSKLYNKSDIKSLGEIEKESFSKNNYFEATDSNPELEAGEYHYSKGGSYKLTWIDKILDFPIDISNSQYLRNLKWYMTLLIVIIPALSIAYLEIKPDFQLATSFKSIYQILIISFLISVSYYLLYFLFRKRFLEILTIPFRAFLFMLILAPIVAAIYRFEFNMHKHPFKTTIVANQVYGIQFYPGRYDTRGVYKGVYMWTNISYLDPVVDWNFIDYIKIKKPPYRMKVDIEKKLFEESRISLINQYKESNKRRCKNAPCMIITLYNRLSLINLEGEEAFGQVVLSSSKSIKSESLSDNITETIYSMLYQKRIDKKRASVMVVDKNDERFKIGKVFAQFNATNTAYDKEAKELKLSIDKEEIKENMDLENLHQKTSEMVALSEEEVFYYKIDMNKLNISDNRFVSMLPYWTLNKKVVVDFSKIDLNKYKVIRVNRIDSSKDGSLGYFLVTATISDFYKKHWIFKPNEPQLNAILP